MRKKWYEVTNKGGALYHLAILLDHLQNHNFDYFNPKKWEDQDEFVKFILSFENSIKFILEEKSNAKD